MKKKQKQRHFKSGLGNLWPTGHMQPTKYLNVAREHSVSWLGDIFNVKIYLKCLLKCLFLRKWISSSIIPYGISNGPRRPNLFPIWPASQKELPTPALNYRFLTGGTWNPKEYEEKLWSYGYAEHNRLRSIALNEKDMKNSKYFWRPNGLHEIKPTNLSAYPKTKVGGVLHQPCPRSVF